MTYEIGKIGVWRPKQLTDDKLAVELEGLGYGALWVGSSPSLVSEIGQLDSVLAATSTLVVGTSIANIWSDDPAGVGAGYHRLADKYPGRFILGIGAGHPEATQEYKKPYQALVDYLDGLDAAGVPVESRALAALGPKVIKLSGDRTAGALPYLTTPEHTRQARELLGPDKLLVAEQKVVLGEERERALAIAREAVRNPYLSLINYTTMLRKLGFTDADLADGGSDQLIDALVTQGDAETVARGLTAHLDAGADHVAVQVLGDNLDYAAVIAAVTPR
ncbi:LLM class F420-dependent oxidoreductase [Amycolatopsis sp. cg5]|uniref:LLM class F420-dependent oxidoreductase n=1 Tax=Amycolatopsis sp. cg5 TaxID=3238802 RepID=UPI00352636F0